jgi:hypothetical protein
MKWLRWFQTYTAHPDQRTALANLVAMLIVSNQPFYPLYVYWLVGAPAWVTFVSFLSTPFFFAVPAIARRNALAGRVLACMAGTLNTAVCVWVIGEASGVAMFYFACILIGVLLFRGSEWIAMAFCTGLPMAAFWFLRNAGTPLHVFSAPEYASLVTLHAVSVGSLIAFVGYKFSTALAAERS